MSKQIEKGSQADNDYASGYVTYYPTSGEVRADLKITTSAENELISTFGAMDNAKYDSIPGAEKNKIAMAVMKKFAGDTERQVDTKLFDIVGEVMDAARLVLNTQITAYVEERSAEIEAFIDSEVKKAGY